MPQLVYPSTPGRGSPASSNDNTTEGTQPVEVYCRMKPLSTVSVGDSATPCITQVSASTVECTINSARPGAPPSRQVRYQFTRVFGDNEGQEAVFEEVAKPLLSEVVQGRNALLFAYGVTGSGKTYTMQGNSRQPGVLPRTLDVLFNSIGDQQTIKYMVKPDSQNGFYIQSEVDAMMERQSMEAGNRLTVKTPKRDTPTVKYLVRERSTVPMPCECKSYYAVFITFVEVYNNSVFDLLQDAQDPLSISSNKLPPTLVLREDGRRVFVAGATELEVKSADEALRLFLTGQQRRRVAQTILNAESSRSHSVFTIRVVRAPLVEALGGELRNLTVQDSGAKEENINCRNVASWLQLNSKSLVQTTLEQCEDSGEKKGKVATKPSNMTSELSHNSMDRIIRSVMRTEMASILGSVTSEETVVSTLIPEHGEKTMKPEDPRLAPTSPISTPTPSVTCSNSTISTVIPANDNRPLHLTTDKNCLVVSQFSMVDLAGSERTGRTGNQGDRLKEASNINNSLMTLRKCVEVLRENQHSPSNATKRMVPYRDQRLTYLFRNFFEGDGHVRILACICAAPQELDETLQVLKFAESSQEIQTFRTPLPPRHPSPAENILSVSSGTPRADMSQRNKRLDLGCNSTSGMTSKIPLQVWDEVVSETLLQSPESLPFPRDASPSYLVDNWPRVSQDCREYLQRRRQLTESAVQGIHKQTEVFRERLQWLLQSAERSHVDERQVARLHESLERERSKMHQLDAKCRNLQADLASAQSVLREERAEKERQVERLRGQVSHLKQQQMASKTPKVHVTRHTPEEQSEGEERRFTGRRDIAVSSAKTPGVTRLQNRKLVTTLAQQWETRAGNNATASTPQLRLPANPRHTPGIGKKRSGEGMLSSSSSSTWIEHHEKNSTPMGTLLSPHIKKRKSVTKLTYEDTLKASNYVLTHQQTDEHGNLEMQLYKGALIPTAGGGTACIFNDVERLTQRPPLSEINPSASASSSEEVH